jgi:hypothetical protein
VRQGKWLEDARGLIERCLLPDRDVLLRRISSGLRCSRFFVAAFADDNGAAVLADRIRGQFERAAPLSDAAQTVSVVYTVSESPPSDQTAASALIVTDLAARLERSIAAYPTW